MQKIIWKKSESIVRSFSSEKEDFHVITNPDLNVKFGAIVKDSQISFTFDTVNENTSVECYFLVPAVKNQNVKLDIQANFQAKNTKILINAIVLAADDASITLNGGVHIREGISNVEARLYEETLLLGNAKYISLLPGLRVDSPDVIASHGAKIQRISPEKIFYMQSRGLSSNKAMNMLIDSYCEQIIEKLGLNEQQKSDFYSLIN